MSRSVAMITVHECPLASSEGKERGGINVYVYELGKALARKGIQVDMFTRKQDTVNPDVVRISDHARVIHVPAGPATPLPKKDIIRHVDEFSRNMAEFMHTEKKSYDVLHAHYYYSGMVAMRLAEHIPYPVPIVVTYHTLGIMKQLASHGGKAGDPAERIPTERAIANKSSRIVTASDTGRQYLSSFYGIPPDKISIVPPGVDTNLFRPMNKSVARQAVDATDSQKIILAIGRIDPVKGFDVLLAAIKILLSRRPELESYLCLYIVGGEVGQRKAQWSRELRRLDSLRNMLEMETTVQFVEPLKQEELPQYYNAADVVVMPSHYESFGMVALEAIACGTPVIATDVTGISPLLKSLPTGHVISANNPLQLAEEIDHVLAQDHDDGDNGDVIAAYDWDRIADAMDAVYQNILQ